MRVVRWWGDLTRLGIRLPLFVAHDFGLLYGAPREQIELVARPGADVAMPGTLGFAQHVAGYRAVVEEIANSLAAVRASRMRLSDDLVVVVLARLLASIAERIPLPPPSPWPATLLLDVEWLRDLERELPRLFAALPRAYEDAALVAIDDARLQVLTLADTLDVNTLQLLGMLAPPSSAASALSQVDLLAALTSPTASDIVNFSLELLPNVLETHRTRSTGTHAEGGTRGWAAKVPSIRWC